MRPAFFVFYLNPICGLLRIWWSELLYFNKVRPCTRMAIIIDSRNNSTATNSVCSDIAIARKPVFTVFTLAWDIFTVSAYSWTIIAIPSGIVA